MTSPNVVIYNRVSHVSQDFTRQLKSLKQIAEEKRWIIKRVFSEKISGTKRLSERAELNKTLQYIKNHDIQIVMTSEVSRLGRRVVDVLNLVETFHELNAGVYIEQFDMTSMVDGKENPSMKLLLQVLAIGAEMENDLRKVRQKQGIEIAKLQGKYRGRKTNAKSDPVKFLKKYNDVVDLVKESNLSQRKISKITGRSINTVRKVKRILNA